MNPLKLVFAPGGRIARLPYFLAHLCLSMVAIFIIVIAIIAMPGNIQTLDSGERISVAFFGLIAILTICIYGYATINLLVKRLHDMGLSGWHSVWIYAVSFVGSMFHMTDSGVGAVIYVVSMVASLAIGMWILFAPGEDELNDYGQIFA